MGCSWSPDVQDSVSVAYFVLTVMVWPYWSIPIYATYLCLEMALSVSIHRVTSVPVCVPVTLSMSTAGLAVLVKVCVSVGQVYPMSV